MTFSKLRLLAILLPTALLLGAYGSQYLGGLYPCEMCWWQRYPHFAAVPIAALSFVISNKGMQKVLVALAALAILTSGVIGGYHAGVESCIRRFGIAHHALHHGTSSIQFVPAALANCDSATP